MTMGDAARWESRSDAEKVAALHVELEACREDIAHLVRQGRAREVAYEQLQAELAQMRRVMARAEADNRVIVQQIRDAARCVHEVFGAIEIHDPEEASRGRQALDILRLLVREIA